MISSKLFFRFWLETDESPGDVRGGGGGILGSSFAGYVPLAS